MSAETRDKQRLDALIARFADQKRHRLGTLNDLDDVMAAVLSAQSTAVAPNDALADLRVRANQRLQRLLEHSKT